MQHVNVKIFAEPTEGLKFGDAIPVFHRWIQDSALPELLIDVADYSHVPAGPGVLLIAYEANYSLDNGRGEVGLLYNRKLAADPDTPETLRQAYDAARSAAERLENEPEFAGKLQFRRGDIEITLNDRLLYPNTEATWATVEPELTRFLDDLFGPGSYATKRNTNPRERLSLRVTH